jgi:hypothetical protein
MRWASTVSLWKRTILVLSVASPLFGTATLAGFAKCPRSPRQRRGRLPRSRQSAGNTDHAKNKTRLIVPIPNGLYVTALAVRPHPTNHLSACHASERIANEARMCHMSDISRLSSPILRFPVGHLSWSAGVEGRLDTTLPVSTFEGFACKGVTVRVSLAPSAGSTSR